MNAETAWSEMERWNKTLKPPMNERELKNTFESALKKYMRKIGTPQVQESEILEKKPMKDISAKDEGKNVLFSCFISAMDEHRTITLKLNHECPSCHDTFLATSNGFENPRTPHCKK